MEKIKQFNIENLSISGFKCFEKQTNFTFGNPTTITGGNGRGKSSIADAIAFAVTGLPFFGERGIDKLYTDGTADAQITMKFVDENHVLHELIRTRSKGRMSIIYDGREIRQCDLTELFGEKDVFLSILNPLYFIEELGENGKSLLERYLPTASHEEIMALLGEKTRENLKNVKFVSPENFLKQKREEKRNFEQDVVYFTGQKDLASSQSLDSNSRKSELSSKILTTKSEIENLEKRQFEGLDLNEIRAKLTELTAQYDSSKISSSDANILELHRKLGEKKASVYVPKYSKQIAEFSASVNTLGAKYKAEFEQGKSISAGTICPTCKRKVGERELPLIYTAFQKSINEIVALGKEKKTKLQELVSLEHQAEEKFKKSKAEEILKIETEIKSLENAEKASNSEAFNTDIQLLSLQAEYGNLTHEELGSLVKLRENLVTLEAELSALNAVALLSEDEYNSKITYAETQILEIKQLISDMTMYLSKRADLTFSKLKMNRVSVSLYEVVKTTGEIKDTFKFTYNGRAYNRLSLSEKVRAGMEISELVKKLTGRNYPVFTDNMESVENLSNVKPTGQIIMAKCVHNAPLSVRAIPTQIQQQAA